MKDFKNKRHYLLRYGIIWTVVCFGATALLLKFRGGGYHHGRVAL